MTKSTENEMGRAYSTCVKRRNAYKILVGKPEDIYLGDRIILKLILDRQAGAICTGFIWLRIRTSDGLLSARQ
jgi:hypothetical protein